LWRDFFVCFPLGSAIDKQVAGIYTTTTYDDSDMSRNKFANVKLSEEVFAGN